MRYQYKREPLTGDEATRLANACNPHEEKLVVWTLLDTGLRVSELANLKRANLDWQTHRLMVYQPVAEVSRGEKGGTAIRFSLVELLCFQHRRTADFAAGGNG